MADCIFCGIVAGDEPATIVASDERTVAFMDINPATHGHALVVPRAHSADVLDCPPADLTAVALMSQQIAQAAMDSLDADGVNLFQASRAVAFQTVFHLHVHVVPRYHDDGLVLPWLPEPGDKESIAAAGATLRSRLGG